MYNLSKIYLKKNNSWTEGNPSSLLNDKVKTLLQTYQDVKVHLRHSSGHKEGEISLTILVIDSYVTEETIKQVLVRIGDTNLPLVPPVGLQKEAAAYYGDAFSCGFQVKFTNHKVHPDNELPIGGANDLLLTKDGVNYAQMALHVLVIVNNHVCDTLVSKHGIYAINGAVQGTGSNVPSSKRPVTVGIVSFDKVATIEQVKINPEKYRDKVKFFIDSKLKNFVLPIRVTKKQQSTIIMARYGKFETVETGLHTSQGEVVFSRPIESITREYFERNDINLKNTKTFTQADMILDELANTTFFVLTTTNSKPLCVDIRTLEYSGMGTCYVAPTLPTGIIVRDNGDVANYFVRESMDRFNVYMDDVRYPNYGFEQGVTCDNEYSATPGKQVLDAKYQARIMTEYNFYLLR